MSTQPRDPSPSSDAAPLERRGANSSAWQADIARLAPWFQNLHLPDGSTTAPEHPLGDYPAREWRQIAPHLAQDLRGMQVLELGCNAGYYSFELARRGARVEGMDSDPRWLEQARWAAQTLGLSQRVSFSRGDLYQLAGHPRRYDLVLVMGALDRLRHPLLALEIAARLCRGDLLLQSHSMSEPERATARASHAPVMSFVERRSARAWVASRACLEAMLRDVGLRVRCRPTDTVVLCKRDPELAQRARAHDAEFRAATGQP